MSSYLATAHNYVSLTRNLLSTRNTPWGYKLPKKKKKVCGNGEWGFCAHLEQAWEQASEQGVFVFIAGLVYITFVILLFREVLASFRGSPRG